MRNGIFLLAAGCVCLVSCHKSLKTTEHAPYKVEVMAVDTVSMVQSRVYSGTIEESSGASLSFSVPGTMTNVSVSAGDHVAKGQLLATLDATSLRNSHAIAVTALNEAQDTYNRMKKLHDSNSLSDMKWVEVENALKAAQSTEAIARRALADANLYAPFSGYVSEKYAESGTNVAPGIPVLKVVCINPVRATISVPENEIASITLGQDATVTGESLPQDSYSGKVSVRDISADPISRSYTVAIDIANDDALLLPGMLCDVRIERTDASEAIVVPNSAVLLDARNNNYVWLAKDGKAVKRAVQAGALVDNGIVIDAGLAVGDTVIVHGQQKVSQGSPVSIVNQH